MIAKIIDLDVIFILVFLLIGFIIHVQSEHDGIKRFVTITICIIVGAIICSYRLFE